MLQGRLEDALVLDVMPHKRVLRDLVKYTIPIDARLQDLEAERCSLDA